MKIPKGNHKTRIPTQTSSQLQQYFQDLETITKKEKRKSMIKKHNTIHKASITTQSAPQLKQ